MNETDGAKNSVSIPGAIIVAGGLIALAVFFSRGGLTSSSDQAASPDANGSQTSSQEISISPISVSDHALGNPSAPLAVVVYTDLECPFCKSFHATMQQVADTYGKDGDVLWVYRDFPLESLHPKAPKEAEASECAAELGGNQAYWDFVDKVFQITPSNNGLDPAQLPAIAGEIGLDKAAFQECLDSGTFASKVQAGFTEAVRAGGRGTPFSVIVSKDPISDTTIQSINALVSIVSPDMVTFSSDKRRIGLSGAVPYNTLQAILGTLLGKN